MNPNSHTSAPHSFGGDEAIERARILCSEVVGFDKPWALAIMRGLLGRIAELKAAKPGGPHSAWVKCSERLPEPNVPVLVTVEGFGITTDELTDSGDWSNFGDEPNLTHWMPLPSGPVATPEQGA